MNFGLGNCFRCPLKMPPFFVQRRTSNASDHSFATYHHSYPSIFCCPASSSSQTQAEVSHPTFTFYFASFLVTTEKYFQTDCFLIIIFTFYNLTVECSDCPGQTFYRE